MNVNGQRTLSSSTRRLYSGSKDGVVVREAGKTTPLGSPRDQSELNGQSRFAWGAASPKGKALAEALLKDALGNEASAAELAATFNARVISILPDRWTMTRDRVLSYAHMMAHEKVNESLLKATAPASQLRTLGYK